MRLVRGEASVRCVVAHFALDTPIVNENDNNTDTMAAANNTSTKTTTTNVTESFANTTVSEDALFVALMPAGVVALGGEGDIEVFSAGKF